MNSRERFYATIRYETPDRPPLAPLWAQPYVEERLFKYFGVSNREDFSRKVGEDFRYVFPDYIGPQLATYDDGSWEGLWGEHYKRVPFGAGTYEESVFQPFKDIETIEQAEAMRYPSPDWYDYSTVYGKCIKNREFALITGTPGYLDFMNGIGFMRGVERVYTDVGLEDEVYLYIVGKRFNFFYEVTRRTLEAAKGEIDVVYCGEDLGTQQGPIISPAKFDKLFADYYRRFFALAHSYGAKTMMHSCGSMRVFIPRLIKLGLDILEAVQVDAANMDIDGLHRDFYKKITFCGSISVQSLLPRGTLDKIRKEVQHRKELFGEGGMIIGPTNCMQADMPTENFVAMCRAIGCHT